MNKKEKKELEKIIRELRKDLINKVDILTDNKKELKQIAALNTILNELYN